MTTPGSALGAHGRGGAPWARIVRLVAVALLVVVARGVGWAADPGLAGVDDILNGRRKLLTTDDLVITNSVWNSNVSTDAQDDVLYTANGTVSSAQSLSVRSAQCGVNSADNGTNEAFPQQTQVHRRLAHAARACR